MKKCDMSKPIVHDRYKQQEIGMIIFGNIILRRIFYFHHQNDYLGFLFKRYATFKKLWMHLQKFNPTFF